MTKHDLPVSAIYNGKCDQKKTCINNSQELKMKNVSVRSRSRLFLPGAGAEPIWSSRSRLRDLGLPEPEQPKKVVDPQHWLIQLVAYLI